MAFGLISLRTVYKRKPFYYSYFCTKKKIFTFKFTHKNLFLRNVFLKKLKFSFVKNVFQRKKIFILIFSLCFLKFVSILMCYVKYFRKSLMTPCLYRYFTNFVGYNFVKDYMIVETDQTQCFCLTLANLKDTILSDFQTQNSRDLVLSRFKNIARQWEQSPFLAYRFPHPDNTSEKNKLFCQRAFLCKV